MNLLEKSVAYCLNIHTMGDHRTVESSKVDLKDAINGTEPDKDSMSVAMKILKCPEYDAVTSLDRKAKKELEKLALPSPFKDGIYLIPIKLIERVNNLVKEYKENRKALVEKFLTAYQAAIDDAKKRLNGFFDSKYYPDADVVRSRFCVNASFFEFGVPTALNDISPELVAQEQEVMREQMQAASEKIQVALRSAFSQLVSHMVNILTPGPDGKYKKFFGSNLESLREFIGTFSARNITEDSELASLVTKAEEILSGNSIDRFRDEDAFKEDVRNKMLKVEENLSTLVTSTTRKFNFGS